MTRSLYQKKEFADFWNKRAGDKGEPYKFYVIDPIMLRLVGDLRGKTIVELGCGNGYLVRRFLAKRARRVVLIDISKYNLEYAKLRVRGNLRVSFLRYDATKRFPIPDSSVDIVYSTMMLNEIGDISTPIRSIFRILRKRGRFIFSITHPAWEVYLLGQSSAGKKVKKMMGITNYFQREHTKYVMGSDTSKKQYLVEHFTRPISDYFLTLTQAGFRIEEFIEPEIKPSMIRKYPRFREYSHFPVSLIFSCLKP